MERPKVRKQRGRDSLYICLSSSRAGPKYLRGSNSSGCSENTFLIAAVIAKRPSESMLIFDTADFAAFLSCSSGIPTESDSFPPYFSTSLTYSIGTEEEPCNTIGNPGNSFSISSRMSNASGGGTKIPSALRVHCSGLNLQRPWLVPIEIASESTPVFETKSLTSSGFV